MKWFTFYAARWRAYILQTDYMQLQGEEVFTLLRDKHEIRHTQDVTSPAAITASVQVSVCWKMESKISLKNLSRVWYKIIQQHDITIFQCSIYYIISCLSLLGIFYCLHQIQCMLRILVWCLCKSSNWKGVFRKKSAVFSWFKVWSSTLLVSGLTSFCIGYTGSEIAGFLHIRYAQEQADSKRKCNTSSRTKISLISLYIIFIRIVHLQLTELLRSLALRNQCESIGCVVYIVSKISCVQSIFTHKKICTF